MKKDYHKILVTRELSDEQLSLAERMGLKVIIEPAIRFEFRDDWNTVRKAISSAELPLFAFTSQNGVKGFERLLDAGYRLPEGVVFYAVGGKTSDALKELGFHALTPELHYGENLGQKIVEDIGQTGIKGLTVFHFCGNRRREEMRQVLESSGVNVRDLVVYKTILNGMHLEKSKPDAVLFYSPSAVEAYRNSGGFRQDRKPELFAIGQTTARELSIESGRHVHVSPKPDTDEFLKFVAQVLDEAPH